jgi:hypothetical protein
LTSWASLHLLKTYMDKRICGNAFFKRKVRRLAARGLLGSTKQCFVLIESN